MNSLRSRPLRHILALAFAVLAWISASALWQMQDRRGPHQQRVNVRFGADVSDEARETFEREHGLLDGEARAERTWIYRLTDQSPANIGALLESPLVEDTAHLDRTRRRVVLDQPELPSLVRELLERQWLPYGAWLLAAAGVVLACLAWRSALALGLLAARWSYAGARATPRVLRALNTRFETLTARHEVWFAFALCAFFLIPMLWHGPTDDEELGLGTFSSQIYYRDLLLHGRVSYWLTNLGFGTPMPLGHRLDFHPVFALGSLISLRVAISSLWIVQLGVMAVYFLRLLALYGLAPRVRLVLLGLYLFSMSSFLYFFTTDWVSCQVPWTLYPVLVYYLRDAFLGGAATRWWLTTVRLGLLFSLWALNGHPGYLVPLFIPLAVYILVAARPTVAVYGALAAAGALALAASGERIYFLGHEMGFFPERINRVTQEGYTLLTFLNTQTAPLTSVRSGRQPFVGAFIFLAAMIAPVMWRTADRHLRGCIVAFFAALALSITPVRFVIWTGLSGVWLFKDAVVFFGLLSAGAVAQSALRDYGRSVRQVVLALLALQVVQQVIVMSPGYRAHWDGNTRLEWYRHQGKPIALAAAVVRAANRYGTRLYLSTNADGWSRGVFSAAGIHVMTDYALLGLNPVNGWFKNVATDRLFPSRMMMHGYIRGHRPVIENPALLDVLGINLIVTMTDERLVPEGSPRVDHLIVNADAAGNVGVDIFANTDAWPKAVLLSPQALAAPLPLVKGCGHPGALCRDYTALAQTRLPQDAAVHEVTNGYQVRVPPSDAPRLLFVSAFYRPEWVATAGGQALEIDPIANAFIGVTVPPGVQDIQLMFRPPIRVALTWVSWAALLVMLVAAGRYALVRSK